MKKTFAVLSLSLLITGACSNQSNNRSEQSNQVHAAQTIQVKDEHLDDLLGYFKQYGFVVGEKTSKMYTMISAIDGCGITIDGQKAEIYEYDSADNNTLAQYKRTGKLVNESAYVNGKFMLGGNVDQKIVEAFKDFK